MKSIRIISQNVPESRFNFFDIENLIFRNINPQVTIKPFVPYLPYKFTIELPFQIDKRNLRGVFNYIIKINDRQVSLEEILKIPFSLFSDLFSEFLRNIHSWQQYCLDNLLEFSESNVSFVNWNIIKNTSYTNFFSTPISIVQGLWINIMTRQDREFWAKFATDIKEDLLPWLNKDLWLKINNADNNKRINEDYEKQKKAMIEGNLEEVVSTFENEVNDEDLDIIK